jgi:hypothetical protein
MVFEYASDAFFSKDTMVDENIMKLEIKKLKQTLEGKADEVLDLNKRRMQLEMVMTFFINLKPTDFILIKLFVGDERATKRNNHTPRVAQNPDQIMGRGGQYDFCRAARAHIENRKA